MNQDIDIILFEMQLFLYANTLSSEEVSLAASRPPIGAIDRQHLPERFQILEFRKSSVLHGAAPLQQVLV